MPLATKARMAAVTVGCALLASCAAGSDPPTPADEAVPHGYVEGAEETAEAQWRLVMAEAATGEVHMLDPATEETTTVATVEGSRAVVTDGRFVFVTGASGTEIVDSGVWTVDHGDHVHYYRTEPGPVGAIDGTGLAPAGDPALTVLNADQGALALDRETLEAGDVPQAVELGAQAALPYAQRLLAVEDGAVTVLDRDGETVAELDESCQDPRAQAVTGRGAVFGCADGALLITGEDEPTAEKIPYPDGAVVVGGFHHRPGTPVLAARGQDGGVLVLDLKERRWSEIEVADAVAVSATGEDAPVLVLTADGTLRSFDPGTGAELARAELMTVDEDAAPPTIQVDTARAYVNDPGGAAVHEIDYRDDLRLARTFALDFRPDHMVETGW